MGKVMLITGATGYLGQRIVLHAVKRGHKVKAVIRPGRDISTMPWFKSDNIEIIEIDLASDRAAIALLDIMSKKQNEAAVIIHAAGAMLGNDAVQQVQTTKPTEYIVQAMRQTGLSRLVLLSSMSIYGYSALPENCQLDETTPSEPYPQHRDAYCRAKLSQETIVLEAAQMHGLVVTAIRPGAVIGPQHLWTSRLGVVKNRLGLKLGRDAILPISFVDHCAEAVVLASEQETIMSDVYVESDSNGRSGAFEAINVFEDNLPTQQQYIKMLKEYTNIWPSLTIYLPWKIIKFSASSLTMFAMIWPGLLMKVPGILREASLHARTKPLRYNNSRLHDRLGWTSKLDLEDVFKLSEPDRSMKL